MIVFKNIYLNIDKFLNSTYTLFLAITIISHIQNENF